MSAVDGPACAATLAAEIAAAGGAVPFERFMEIALYGPGGFYSHSSAGRRGDFLTSPEVGPLFGALVARYVTAEWERCGRPERFSIVDLGAGPGTLARTVLLALDEAAPACRAACTYLAVEVSEHQRRSHPDSVVSSAELPSGAITGVVVANELLDNLPFGLAVYDDGWREALIGDGGDGTFVEILGPRLDPRPVVLPESAPHGARAPLHRAARRLVEHLLASIGCGSLLVVDYAVPLTAELALRPYRDWLRTYRRHERGEHYLRQPGRQDITTEVALDQLPEPDAVRSQSQWLKRWGIDDLVDEGRRYWEEHAARPDLAAMRMRSRISEAEALLDRDGLGGFTVVEWRR